MSRGFKALKVWMSLKHYGVEGYRTLLRQNLRCAEYLDELVRSSSDFEALHQPTLFIYSFRYAPETARQELEAERAGPGEIDDYFDQLNQQIADAIQLSGLAFLMTSKVRGRVVLRLSICSHRTTLDDIDLVFAKIRQLGQQLHRKG
jgi:glutamate/tyrosine decarboxylase-like PLP-dependent enzyme